MGLVCVLVSVLLWFTWHKKDATSTSSSHASVDVKEGVSVVSEKSGVTVVEGEKGEKNDTDLEEILPFDVVEEVGVKVAKRKEKPQSYKKEKVSE